jgi:amino acid efflux transporter
VVAWGFDSLLGLPLALTFAALAARHPDAGGVSTYTRIAFGPTIGMVVGWFYVIAASSAQSLVALTGAYYAAPHLGLDRTGVVLLAAAILVVATATNSRGLRVSARAQLLVSGTVTVLLVAAVLVSIPRLQADRWEPFAPQGWPAVGSTAVLIFFAFFGWEAICHLSSEFRDPARDVPRSTVIAVVLISVLFIGVAVATVGTGTYGDPEVDRTAIARLVADPLGAGVGVVAAGVAVLIALGTTNAFLAASSRLAYALSRDGVFPARLGRITPDGVPLPAVLAVGGFAIGCLVLTALVGWGAEEILLVPNALVIVVYAIGTAAGVRLLTGPRRAGAVVACVLCLVLLPFAGFGLLAVATVAAAALLYRRRRMLAADRN